MAVGWISWLDDSDIKRWTWATSWPPKPASVSDAADIHVVRGTTSRNLRPEVAFWERIGESSWVRFENDVMFATEPNKLASIEFIPRLVIGAAGMVLDAATQTFKGFGIEIDKTTGAVTATSPKPTTGHVGRSDQGRHLDDVDAHRHPRSHHGCMAHTVAAHGSSRLGGACDVARSVHDGW